MSVTTTEKFSVYWNYQVWHLAKGETVSGGLADYLLETGSPVEEVAVGPAVDLDGDGVPDGTAKQVLDWVGEDRDRAAMALGAELGQEKPRSTLIGALEKQVGDPASDENTN
jgi:hypothetical protein